MAERSGSAAELEAARGRILGLIDTGTGDQAHRDLEREIRRPDGERRIVQTTIFPIETELGGMVGEEFQ